MLQDAGRKLPSAGIRPLLRGLLGGRRERIDMLSTLRSLHERHGDAVRMGAGGFHFVYLFGPEANRRVLLDRERLFSARRPWMQIMGRIFPNGLLLLDGDEHKHHRKIMHQAFKRGALREYGERMHAMIGAGLARWGEGRILAFPALKELTLDMAASLFLGVELGGDTRRMNRAFEAMVAASMSRVRLRIPGLEFQRGLAGREFMLGFLGDLIAKKRKGEGADMMSRLCRAETEEGERFADREVLDHMVFLMMAAHDTTTSTLTSMTYEVARHPDWQERLREEGRALGEHVGFDDLDALDSLGWVMKETLRRYPPLPVIPRVAEREFEFGEYRVPAGAMVVVSPIHSHHMKEWWDEPFAFQPDRFAPGRAEHERHTHSWIPFGAGPHHCLGRRFAELQIKAVMHQLLRRYRFRVEPGYEMPVQQAPISKPMDGLPLFLSPLG